MPSSNFGHLMDILSTISLIRPNSILEVGVGFGKYGFLTRELLDLKEGKNRGYGYKNYPKNAKSCLMI